MMQTQEDLEERLSRPSPADVRAVREIEGDLMILGVAGKMGPSLALLARRAIDEAGIAKRILAVARFSDSTIREKLDSWGIETIATDLLDQSALAKLPDCPNVIFMAARKFNTTGAEYLTWALNTYLPGLAAERFRDSKIVAFSTGNVYPLRLLTEGGATETTPPSPVGEYAQSALGRERMFEYGSSRWGTKVAILRLNYAIDLRYGVLLDIGSKVYEQKPLDLQMGYFNAIWQGDANSICLRAFAHCGVPPAILNVTGLETLSVREIANQFSQRFGRSAILRGTETDSALLSDASRMQALFGAPAVSVEEMIDWTANWISGHGHTYGKPTHFEVRDGKF
jgi:nucleoside-diphosphate-sugar epimerase